MKEIKIALDWTANTNHTGFYVADHLGFYATEDLLIEIITPDIDHYQLTPAKKLELGQVDFAVAPSESVISLNTKKNRVNARAVATLLQEDMSAIATLASSNIHSPKELDGKVYASYHARYEDAIVRQMIRQAGGTGCVDIHYPEKLGIWNTLLSGKADATWIFINWEGIDAESNGIELSYFQLSDYHIPYGYSPILMSKDSLIQEHHQAYRAFLKATKKGFLYAQENPEESIDILAPYIPPNELEGFNLIKSQRMTACQYGNAANWGKMDMDRVKAFASWLHEKGLEETPLEIEQLFTNELLRAT